MKVDVDKLSDAVMGELWAYSEASRKTLAESFKQIVNRCVKTLRQTSPSRTGGYAKSWTKRLVVTDETVQASAYNKKFYSLTHLLEHGHAKPGGGRVEGIPHIAPVQEMAAEEALDAVVDAFEEN